MWWSSATISPSKDHDLEPLEPSPRTTIWVRHVLHESFAHPVLQSAGRFCVKSTQLWVFCVVVFHICLFLSSLDPTLCLLPFWSCGLLLLLHRLVECSTRASFSTLHTGHATTQPRPQILCLSLSVSLWLCRSLSLSLSPSVSLSSEVPQNVVSQVGCVFGARFPWMHLSGVNSQQF